MKGIFTGIVILLFGVGGAEAVAANYEISMGMSGGVSRGNTDSNKLKLDMELKKGHRGRQFFVKSSGEYQKSNGRKITDKAITNIGLEGALSPLILPDEWLPTEDPSFGFFDLRVERDIPAGIKEISSVVFGVGYADKLSKSWDFYFKLGGGPRSERMEGKTDSDGVVQGRLEVGNSFLIKTSTLTVDGSVDTKRIAGENFKNNATYKAQLKLSVPFMSIFSMDIKYDFRRINNPAPGAKKEDYSLEPGFSMKVAF